MSIIKALAGSISSVMSDQWKELFICDALPDQVMIVKGKKVTNSNNANTQSDENVITDGSIICVADGQCALVIEQGKVICEFSEPGEHVFHSDRSPSLLNGSSAKSVINEIGYRFTFGGNVVPLTQRVYYINTKECTGNPFSLSEAIPIHIQDTALGLDVDVSMTCSGYYSFKITEPSLFYKNVTGNVQSQGLKTQVVKMMHSEILTELPNALQKVYHDNIRPFELPSKTVELSESLNQILSAKWSGRRGIQVVSFAFDNIGLTVNDMKDITSLQKLAVLKDPMMAASQIVDAQSVSMKMAASNHSLGNGFIGFHLQAQPGHQGDLQNNPTTGSTPQSDTWTCKCGNTCSTSFCQECGSPKPVSWICKCGQTCSSKFCTNCGCKKP